MITLNGDTGITTPGLINTGSTTLINLTTTGNTILGDQSTDTLNVANGNLVLNSSGNLGIGTASPAARLDVSGGSIRVNEDGVGTKIITIRSDWAGVDPAINVTTSNSLLLMTSNTERARITSGGNLLIGGTSATTMPTLNRYVSLQSQTNNDVVGYGLYVNEGVNSRRGSLFLDDSTGLFGLDVTAGSGVPNIVFRTAGTERVRINSSDGNVGIGTASPSSILTLSQAQAPITTFWGSARADGNPYTAGGIESSFVTRDGIPALGAFIRILDVNTFGAFPTTIRGGAITFGTVDGLSGQGVNATERVRIDSSGNMGIGTTSPQQKLVVSNSGALGFEFVPASGIMQLYNRSGSAYGNMRFDAQTILFYTGASPTETARITANRRWCINTTTEQFSSTMTIDATGNSYNITSAQTGTGTQGHMVFGNANGAVGTIQTTGSSTAYNTSSDYRLKNTIAPMTGALARVAQLRPVTYKWNVDGADGEGFIAHELAEVVPHAVTGEKDAVDADGKPQYQGIDVSFLVATLTAAIQELKAELDSVKSELATIKGAA